MITFDREQFTIEYNEHHNAYRVVRSGLPFGVSYKRNAYNTIQTYESYEKAQVGIDDFIKELTIEEERDTWRTVTEEQVTEKDK